MRTFKGYISIGLVGCRREFSFEVDDDADDSDIEEIAREVVFDLIDWDFKEEK